MVEVVALDDPPEIKELNPVHAEGGGAQAAGFDRPIVGGVSSYAWAVAAVVELLGESWLQLGWAEFRLRLPVFAGDTVRATATAVGDDMCEFRLDNPDGGTAVSGRAGLGIGSWDDPWLLPDARSPVPPADPQPQVQPEDAPGEGDLRPMAWHLDVDEAVSWAQTRMGDMRSCYVGDAPLVHPSWVIGAGVPIIQHTMTGPEIGLHAGGRVQHLEALRAPVDLELGGRWIRHEERKQRWWSALDFVAQTADGDEIAYWRQEAIILPPYEPTDS